SALMRIAIQLQLTENNVDVSDEIDSSLCDKADQSTKSLYPSADRAGETNNPTRDCSNRPGEPYGKGCHTSSNRACSTSQYSKGCHSSPKSSVSSFTRNIKCSCNTDANNVSTCHVTGIDWSNKKLEGVIVKEFGNLTYLEKLDLSYNKLHDTIPDIWGNMSSLYILDLSHNKFTGEIPKSLGNKKPQIENYKNESEICVHFLMDLSYNQLEGPILATLGDLEKDLTDHERSLKLFSYCIFSFEIDLSDNRLTGNIPQNLGNLKFLKNLYLDHNLLNGSIPESLGKITYLRYLSVSDNQLSGEIPPALGNLRFLETLSIAGNNLAGPFPDFITKWPNIRTLNLVGNNFSGNIPAEIFNRSSLYHLMISGLTDSSFQFPSFNWTNSSLLSLVLRNCSIKGSIPENIGFIPNLYKLDLSFNELTGNIPSSLGKVSSRYLNSYISLAENKLSGTIPDWIPSATNNSIVMDLSFNDFSNSSFNFGSNYTKLNLFSCCRSCNSSTCEPQMKDVSEYSKNVCQSQPKKKTLHINCGGEETDINGIIYESDTDSSPFYKSPHGNWARISSGEQSIVEKVKCGIFVTDAPLYDEARVSTVSLKYYGLCLENGEYNVTLHFAEIKFADNTDEPDNTDNDQGDQSSKKRIFNINIQNQWVKTDFNIKETAGEAKKETKVEVPTVQVNNSRLEIHLYWAGKGSYSLNNGPLISAISVVPSDLKRGKLSRLHVALISVASVVVFVLLLVFIIAWAMGWLRKEEMH
ncbi:hypothetical protein UlMin_037813, partial [Ulmus minor]